VIGIIELQNKDFLKTTSKGSNNLKIDYSSLFEIDFKGSKIFAKNMIITTFGTKYICKKAFTLIKYQKK